MAEVIAMAGDPSDQPKAAQVYPKCPDCKTQPLLITVTPVMFPTGLMLGVSSCATCGHVFSTFPMGMKEPNQIPARSPLLV